MATINKIQANGTTYDVAVSGANVSGAVASAGTLTGLTATVAELNYCDGVTSNIQTQINNLGKSVADGKQSLVTAISEASDDFGGSGIDVIAPDLTNESTFTEFCAAINSMGEDIALNKDEFVQRNLIAGIGDACYDRGWLDMEGDGLTDLTPMNDYQDWYNAQTNVIQSAQQHGQKQAHRYLLTLEGGIDQEGWLAYYHAYDPFNGIGYITGAVSFKRTATNTVYTFFFTEDDWIDQSMPAGIYPWLNLSEMHDAGVEIYMDVDMLYIVSNGAISNISFLACTSSKIGADKIETLPVDDGGTSMGSFPLN